MTEPSDLSLDVNVDSALLDVAQRDVFRTLVLQNSRVAQRFDPAGRYRTPKVESGLHKIGTVLCWAAVSLSVVLLALGWMIHGGISGIAIACLIGSMSLLVLFKYLHEIRQWGIRKLDRTLERRATAQLASLREAAPLTLRYTVSVGKLRCEQRQDNKTTLRFERPLDRSRYALIGEACVALFPTTRKQTPNVIILATQGSAAARWRGTLVEAGLEVETLRRELMPKTTVERAW